MEFDRPELITSDTPVKALTERDRLGRVSVFADLSVDSSHVLILQSGSGGTTTASRGGVDGWFRHADGTPSLKCFQNLNDDIGRDKQNQLARQIARLRSDLVDFEEAAEDVTDTLNEALDLVRDCAEAYAAASPELRRRWNQVFFERIEVGALKVTKWQDLPNTPSLCPLTWCRTA